MATCPRPTIQSSRPARCVWSATLADYGSVTAASFAVGAQVGVSRETLRCWVAQAEVDDGARPGLTTAEADELRRLRAENKRLWEANEILKAASIFFAGELDSRNR